ncbi:MAG: PAS domain S-box protein [Bacteroidota bacterium]|nr:PAS domain S-box protein [Bacteroidota bacterium]
MISEKKTSSNAKREFIIIVLAAIAVLILSIKYQLNDHLVNFAMQYRQFYLDEFVLMMLTLSVMFGIFSYRRWRELQHEKIKHSTAEQSLRETEQRSQALLTTIPNLTFRINRNGIYLDFSTGNPDDLYTSQDQVIGKTLKERLPADIAELYQHHIELALSTKIVQAFEYELLIQGSIKNYQARMFVSGKDEVFVLVRNITESQVISEALAQSETRFRAVVESLSEGLVLTDLEDNVIYMNQRMTELCGWTMEELQGKPAYAFLLAEHLWPLQEQRNKSRGQGFAERYELEMVRKDGTHFWAEVYGSPFRDSNRQIIGSIGTITDITEAKWNERLQSALYRITTLSHVAEDIQQLFKNIHEIVGELMYAKNFYIALHEPVQNMISFPYFVDEVDTAPEPREFSHGSTEYVLETGNILHAPQPVFDQLSERGALRLIGAPAVDWLGVPLRSGNKTFGVLVIQSYDPKIIFGDREKEILVFVSQHISSVIQQKFEEERFRTIWEHSADGMRVSNKNGTIVMVNQAYCTLVKKNKEELVGQTVNSVYDREYLSIEESDELYRQRFATNTIKSRDEVEIFLWNKETLIVEITASYITFGINERMLLCIFRDVTERKRLEDRLLHAQKMDSIGVLAGGIAHDFNNVLAMILGSAELIKHKAQEYPEILKFAQMIASASERGSSIAKQLLMFARTEKGVLKPISLSSVVLDVCQLLEHSIPKSIKIQTNFLTDNDIIKGDEDQLHQIIINLAVNARDAIEVQALSNGMLTFTVKNESGDSLRRRYHHITSDVYVVLEVADTGAGMDNETMRRIFEPFFSTKARGKGTGLGLSIVHGIMKSHNGFVDVKSTISLGTTFSLFFPATRTAVPLHAEQKI